MQLSPTHITTPIGHRKTTKMHALLAFAMLGFISFGRAQAQEKPNIIFLLTDDQDVTANSLDYMPKLNRLLRKQGMEFVNYFVPTGLCCPSRATIISGQFCHNTKIWDNGDLNNQTYMSGGFKKAMSEGLETHTIATQLKAAGYETFLIGKYLNGYSDSQASHVPPGWDHWFGMTDTAYFGPHFSNSGTLLKLAKDVYQTDFIGAQALKMLEKRDAKKPFFIYIAPFAPHAPSLPAPRHANLFPNITAPRNPSYNPSDEIQKQKPSWIKHLPPLTETQLGNIDAFYQRRLQALQAVDELLENITLFLEKESVQDNTYLFYMGDNGQHLGDYRLPAGKRQAYDTDIRVPFLARGPGIEGGVRVTQVVQSIDLLPTWIDLAGGELPPYEPDGKSIVPLLKGSSPAQPSVNNFRSVGLAEMYGGSGNMGDVYKGMAGFERNRFWNNTYQAIRVINGSDWAANANWLYAEWCTGEKEFYNVSSDPHEIYNIIDQLDASLVDKLSALVEAYGKCAGTSCQNIDLKNLDLSKVKDKTLKCFNPPDMPGAGDHQGQSASDDQNVLLMHSDINEVLTRPNLCQSIVSNGLPYSDSDEIPLDVLDVWHFCLSSI